LKAFFFFCPTLPADAVLARDEVRPAAGLLERARLLLFDPAERRFALEPTERRPLAERALELFLQTERDRVLDVERERERALLALEVFPAQRDLPADDFLLTARLLLHTCIYTSSTIIESSFRFLLLSQLGLISPGGR